MAIKKSREARVAQTFNGKELVVQLQTRDSGKVEWLAGKTLTIPLGEIPEEYKQGEERFPAKVYCLQKLLQERTSDCKESAALKYEAMETLWLEVLSKGEWNAPRVAGERKDYSLVIIALYELAKVKQPSITLPVIQGMFAKKTAEEKKALAQRSDVVSKIDEIKAQQNETVSDFEL